MTKTNEKLILKIKEIINNYKYLLKKNKYLTTKIKELENKSKLNYKVGFNKSDYSEYSTITLVSNFISQAQNELLIANYSLTHKTIAENLALAKNERNISIQIIIDNNKHKQMIKDYPYISKIFEKLEKNNINIHFFKSDILHNIMHHKFMISDEKSLLTGSFNLTKSDDENNAENILILNNVPEIALKYKEEWYRLFNHLESKKS